MGRLLRGAMQHPRGMDRWLGGQASPLCSADLEQGELTPQPGPRTRLLRQEGARQLLGAGLRRTKAAR